MIRKYKEELIRSAWTGPPAPELALLPVAWTTSLLAQFVSLGLIFLLNTTQTYLFISDKMAAKREQSVAKAINGS